MLETSYPNTVSTSKLHSELELRYLHVDIGLLVDIEALDIEALDTEVLRIKFLELREFYSVMRPYQEQGSKKSPDSSRHPT